MELTIWLLSFALIILFVVRLCSGTDNTHMTGILTHKNEESSFSDGTRYQRYYFHILINKNGQRIRKVEVTEVAYSKFNKGDTVLVNV